MRKALSAALLGLAVAGCANVVLPSHQPLLWSAEAAANWSDASILLNNSQGKPLRRISRPKVRALVDAEKRLEPVAGVAAVLYLVEGDQPNGYSYLGSDGKNNIAVTLGMLDLVGDDEDECAALVGHELAHLALGHGAKRQEREGVRAAASTAAGVALTLAHVPFGANAADVTSTAISSAYSRDEEREADSKGLDYAKRAGFDPAGAVRLWERLSKVAPNDGPLSFLQTHPSSAERLEAMRKAAAE